MSNERWTQEQESRPEIPGGNTVVKDYVSPSGQLHHAARIWIPHDLERVDALVAGRRRDNSDEMPTFSQSGCQLLPNGFDAAYRRSEGMANNEDL